MQNFRNLHVWQKAGNELSEVRKLVVGLIQH